MYAHSSPLAYTADVSPQFFETLIFTFLPILIDRKPVLIDVPTLR
jgi:hypothetical protein